jgi:hypothetical protein
VTRRNVADFEDVEEAEDNFNTSNVVEPAEKLLDDTDPAWSDYVMSLFVANELKDGKPRVHGLRRVGKLVLGDTYGVTAEIVDTPSEYNGRRYVARCRIDIYKMGSFEDVGDCSLDDNRAFSQYPAALALTRAEARVLRKVLKLNVCAAEEITNESDDDDKAPWNPDVEPDMVTQQQLNYMTNQCKKLKINTTAFAKKYGSPTGEFKNISSEVAQNMITELNGYMKVGVEVPVELRLKGK